MVLSSHQQRSPARLRRRWAGGSDGNQRLTTVTGLVLLIAFAGLGVTILQIHQLLSAHMFLGMLLLGPVALKMGSTGYRFVRYYTGSRAYRQAGPPATTMRLLAPLVVASTVLIFISGVALLLPALTGGEPGSHCTRLASTSGYCSWCCTSSAT